MVQASRKVSAIFAGVALWIFCPVGRARRGIDPDDSILANAYIAQCFRDATGLRHLREEILRDPSRSPSPIRRRWAAKPGATTEPTTKFRAAMLFREPLQVVVGGIDIDMRSEQEKIHAIEVRSVHLGRGGEVEHGVEIDGRLGIRTLAHQSGPHRIVESGKIVQSS